MVSVGEKATMIFGNTCTRSCGFCGVKQVALKQWTGMTRKSSTLDKNNEYHHAVITSVDRDDLKRWWFYNMD
jgi:lipoic acid synthetase